MLFRRRTRDKAVERIAPIPLPALLDTGKRKCATVERGGGLGSGDRKHVAQLQANELGDGSALTVGADDERAEFLFGEPEGNRCGEIFGRFHFSAPILAVVTFGASNTVIGRQTVNVIPV